MKNNTKEIVIPISDTSVNVGVILLNGVFKLTNREMEVLAWFLLVNSAVPCKTEDRKAVAANMDLKNVEALNNIIQALRKKGAIKKNKDAGGYEYHPLFKGLDGVKYINYTLDKKE